MSQRPLPLRLSATTVVAAAALLGTTLVLTPAAAAEPGRAQRTCAEVLHDAALWPGSIPLHGGTYQVYSDAFMTHLAAQPPCTTPGG
jgi:hypothetical protein